MSSTRALAGALVGLSLLLHGCTADEATLLIDLRTDLVAGEEFYGVSVTVAQLGGGTVGSDDRLVRFGEQWVDGRRVLEQSGLAFGSYRITAEVLNVDGAVLATRRTTVQVDGDYAFTTVISRDARSCDESMCSEEESCGSGRCASVMCSPESIDACPAPQCMASADCGARADCSIPVCVEGVCLYGALDGGCGSDEWCNPDDGCTPRTPQPDAGVDAGPDAGGCAPGTADCDGEESNGCEQNVNDDPTNCGACGTRCNSATNGAPACVAGACALECDDGYGDCDGDVGTGCEADLSEDALNCSRCGSACPSALPICIDSDCLGSPFPSDGSDGAFAPASDMTLTAGTHRFTTIEIPAGVTVTADGSGVLELLAQGEVRIEGTIDVSGGNGGSGTSGLQNTGGGGGSTGTRVAGAAPMAEMCHPGGGGGTGAPGFDGGLCGAGGRVGGGSGSDLDGGGGGGYAGGGGGGGGGGAGASSGGASGGANGCGGRGGEEGTLFYGGQNGESYGCCNICGGGGGSVGADAVTDLAMATTFRPGSGGGGGSGSRDYNSAGGGGGGGAVRIASGARIIMLSSGRILARGGAGGRCDSAFCGGGGGGSGGAIYLSAPELDLMGEINTEPGIAGYARLAGGGAGGVGRIRLSVLPGRCDIAAAMTPPLDAGCVETNVPERTYIGVWPD